MCIMFTWDVHVNNKNAGISWHFYCSVNLFWIQTWIIRNNAARHGQLCLIQCCRGNLRDCHCVCKSVAIVVRADTELLSGLSGSEIGIRYGNPVEVMRKIKRSGWVCQWRAKSLWSVVVHRLPGLSCLLQTVFCPVRWDPASSSGIRRHPVNVLERKLPCRFLSPRHALFLPPIIRRQGMKK